MQQQIKRFGRNAVILNMFGIVFSGLVFPLLSSLLTPQPPWKDAELFILSFNLFQTATFFFGFFLVLGSMLTFIALYYSVDNRKKIMALSGLLINVVFTAVVFLNYVIQTTYVPYLAMNNPPETAIILPALTMANPGSFAWALEMYGWGGIGLSYIFMSAIFGESKTEKTLRVLFLANGISSCFSAIMTSVDMNWLFSPAGFIALVTWNVLVFIIDLYLLRFFKVHT